MLKTEYVESESDICTMTIPVWKRALDLFCILLASPFISLVMVVIALFIVLVSPGPIFYTQQRVGLGGRRFKCYKFRSMKVNAETDVHKDHLDDLIKNDLPMTKMDQKDDPRLIPFGCCIRSSGLDELPQLFNVVLGDMSLVGPRPCTPYEYDHYTTEQKKRFETLPGLTGLWQVSGKNRTTFSQMIEMDIRYAETKTLWMDIKIMAKTIPALINQVKDSKQKNPECES